MIYMSKIYPKVDKETQIKYRKGELGDLLKKHRDTKLNDIKSELTDYKSKNLKLVDYLKYFNPVEEVYDELTKNKKRKKSYVRLNDIDKKSFDKVSNVAVKTIAKIEMCMCKVSYITDFHFENKKIIEINRCHNRFCPMCSKILSSYYALAYQSVVDYLIDEYEVDIYFLTLTYPNVSSNDLEKSIREDSRLLNNFLVKNKIMKKVVVGTLGKLETTYNNDRKSKSYKTYHPHYHYLIAVPKSIAKENCWMLEKDYILQKWREYKQDDSITQVDIRKLKHRNEYGIHRGVLELTKYIAKDSNYLLNKDVFGTFYNALKGKRQYRPSGIFKYSIKKFKNSELNDYIKDEYIDYVYKITYSHINCDYKLKEFRDLTEEEKVIIQLSYKDSIVKQFNKREQD